MVLRQRLYTIDDVWEFAHQAENENVRFELIEGELIRIPPPGFEHGDLVIEIAYCLKDFVKKRDLGRVTAETGYHPPDTRHTLLSPDVAFLSHARSPKAQRSKYVPNMPELAVEVMSPSDTLKALRAKAARYLDYGAEIVWIVSPAEQGVEVCRAGLAGDMNTEFIGRDGTLQGDHVLPGFALDLREIFPLTS